MTVDLYGPGGPGLGLGWRRWARFCPQRPIVYILMPESLLRHNNTIGLMSVFSALGLRQTIAIFALTPREAPHISAAPTANGCTENVTA